MTGLTIVTVAFLAAALSRHISLGRALAVGGATPAGAALIVGTTSVPTFYAAAMGALGVLVWRVMTPRRQDTAVVEKSPPGLLLLYVFLGWSLVVTLSAPLMFDGLDLVHPETAQLVAGSLTSSNLAQAVYLLLGTCVVVYLARADETRASLLGLAVGGTLLLSLGSYLSDIAGLPFPAGFFDSSTSFVYIETAAGGVERVRGILAEPAALATTCVTAIAYFVPRGAQVRRGRRWGCGLMVAIALLLGVVSTSTTFIVAGFVCGAVYALVHLTSFAARRSTMSTAVGLLVSAGIAAAAVWAPPVIAFVRDAVSDKLESSSAADRSSANYRSFEIFLDTFGWGVGLGSARSSSMLITLLTAVGVIGAVLAVVAVCTIVSAGRRDPDSRPVVYCLTAFLIAQAISGADLADSSGVLWISLGVLARSASRLSQRRDFHALDSQVELPASARGARAGPARPARTEPTTGSSELHE